jgi:GNAT superfamily N-acetyltransferase
MDVKIKIALIKDLETLLPLVVEFHEFEGLQTTEVQKRTSLSTLLENSALGGIWLIWFNHQLVGYIALCFGYSIEFGGRDAFIDEFYIRTEFRGQGIGKRTLELIKIAAGDRQIRALHLEVARANPNAHQLYSHCGFETREKYVLMSAKL